MTMRSWPCQVKIVDSDWWGTPRNQWGKRGSLVKSQRRKFMKIEHLAEINYLHQKCKPEPCCESIITCGEVSSYSNLTGETVCASHPGCAANHFRAGEAPTPSSWSTQKVRDGAMAQWGNTSCPFSAPCLIQTFRNCACFFSGDARLCGSWVHIVME